MNARIVLTAGAALLAVLASAAPSPEPDEYVPKRDVLEDVLARAKWRMPVADLRRAFKGLPLTADKWLLGRRSFRNEVTLTLHNTKAVFEFSGTVAPVGKPDEAASSSLVAFTIVHPVKPHPRTHLVRPPEGVHHQYLQKLHARYAAALKKRGVAFEADGRDGLGYRLWDRCTSAEGTFTFVYWSNTSGEGVFASAPEKLVADDVERERSSARERTKDWPARRGGR